MSTNCSFTFTKSFSFFPNWVLSLTCSIWKIFYFQFQKIELKYDWQINLKLSNSYCFDNTRLHRTSTSSWNSKPTVIKNVHCNLKSLAFLWRPFNKLDNCWWISVKRKFNLLPIKFSTGTLVLSKYTSVVLEPLIPIFFSGGPLVTPPKLLSTTKAEILSLIVPSGPLTGVWIYSNLLSRFTNP